jgi:hypothetical protein
MYRNRHEIKFGFQFENAAFAWALGVSAWLAGALAPCSVNAAELFSAPGHRVNVCTHALTWTYDRGFVCQEPGEVTSFDAAVSGQALAAMKAQIDELKEELAQQRRDYDTLSSKLDETAKALEREKKVGLTISPPPTAQ